MFQQNYVFFGFSRKGPVFFKTGEALFFFFLSVFFSERKKTKEKRKVRKQKKY
jgi:hypothetical protein